MKKIIIGLLLFAWSIFVAYIFSSMSIPSMSYMRDNHFLIFLFLESRSPAFFLGLLLVVWGIIERKIKKKAISIFFIFVMVLILLLSVLYLFSKPLFTNTFFDKSEFWCKATFGNYSCPDLIPLDVETKKRTLEEYEEEFCSCNR